MIQGTKTFKETTLVIIPACNEEACVGDVVCRLQNHGFKHIRVVDNGSSDQTAGVARAAASIPTIAAA